MVGTFQEILDSNSGNWERIKSITDLRVLSFVGSSEAKYSSTELNFGRLRERGWCIVLRSPRVTTFEPPAAASSGPRRRTAWRTRQAMNVCQSLPQGRRYGRDLR